MAADSSPSPSQVSGLQIRWIEIFVAIWLTLVYVHRIFVEIYLYHPKAAGSIWKSLLSPQVLLMFLFGAPLFLIAVGLRKEGLDQLENGLSGLARAFKTVLLDWRSYVVGVFALIVLLLVQGIREDLGFLL